jgi:hypothetical protein
MKARIAAMLRSLAQHIDPVPRSEIYNCYFWKRPSDEVLMDFRNGGIAIITLRGYTIAPTEIIGIPPDGKPPLPGEAPIIRASGKTGGQR